MAPSPFMCAICTHIGIRNCCAILFLYRTNLMLITFIIKKKNYVLASNISVKNSFRFFCNKENLNEFAKFEIPEVTNQDDLIAKTNVNNNINTNRNIKPNIQNESIDNRVKIQNSNDKSIIDSINAATEFDFDTEFNKLISDNATLSQKTNENFEELPNKYDYKNENCLYSLIKVNLSPKINNLFVNYYIHKILPKASKKDAKPKVFEFDDSLNFFDVQEWEYNEQFKDEKTKAEVTKKMELSIRQIMLKAFDYSIMKFYSHSFRAFSDFSAKIPRLSPYTNPETFLLFCVTALSNPLKEPTSTESIRFRDKFKIGLIFYPIPDSDNNKETIKNKNFSFFLFIKYYNHTLNKNEKFPSPLFKNYKINNAPFLDNNSIQGLTLMSCAFWNYAINKLFTLLPVTDEKNKTNLNLMKETLVNKKTLLMQINQIVSRFFKDDKVYAMFAEFWDLDSPSATDPSKEKEYAHELYIKSLNLTEKFNDLMKMSINNKHIYLEPCSSFLYNGLDNFLDSLKNFPSISNSQIIRHELQNEKFENAFKLEFKRLKAFDEFKRNLINYQKPNNSENITKKKAVPKASSKKIVKKNKKDYNTQSFDDSS